MSKILIIRFSALGDVAMTIPVIYSMAVEFPNHEITVLSANFLKPLFHDMPQNVNFIGVELKARHQGINGLNLLYKELRAEKFDYVADFHSVLRTHFLRFRFKIDGIRTAKIDKGRAEKRSLIRRKNKVLTPLQTGFSRYHKVLEKLGFKFALQFNSIFDNKSVNRDETISLTGEKKELKWIGIAPFAKHKGKIYPLDFQQKIIEHFSADKRVKVFVFGGGESEKSIIDRWTEQYSTIVSTVGKLNMNQEIVLMNQLDVMLTMDSANMHLASLVNTTVVSIWGATHPFAGFMGWNQSIDNAIQANLDCRPCSIYGNKPCFRNDYACMNQISPESVVSRIETILFK